MAKRRRSPDVPSPERHGGIDDQIQNLDLESLQRRVDAKRLLSITDLRIDLALVRQRNDAVLRSLQRELDKVPELDRLAMLCVLHFDLERVLRVQSLNLSDPSTPKRLGRSRHDRTCPLEALEPLTETLFG